MRRYRALLTTLAMTLIVAGLASLFGAQAQAATGPTFPVMNTSEQPPDGVWFRNSPHTADTSKITGLGVYSGETVQASCFANGDAVGSYGNQIWYYVYNVTRPSAAGRSNEGWINTHYVDDGQTANHAHPSVPACGSAPPPPPPSTIGIYADPYEKMSGATYEFRYTSAATIHAYFSNWSSGASCDSTGSYTRLNSLANGHPVGWMASWSKSRYAPLYYLHNATSAQRMALKYILMIDPGNYADMASCGNGSGNGTAGTPFDAGAVLARWLNENPDARLIVIDGNYTRTDHSSGIQNVLFNDVRNSASGSRQRVGVCEYSLAHDPDSFRGSEYYIERPITSTMTCPTLENNNGPLPGSMWHP